MTILFRYSADVPCSAENAFHRYTDPAHYCERDPNIVEFEVLGAGAAKVGSRNRKVYNVGGERLDVVETLLEYDPPQLIASRSDLRGFLLRNQSYPGEMVPSMSQLETHFRWAFGSGEVYELTLVHFEPTGPNSCRLELTSQHEIGGLVWLEFQLRRLFGSNPLRKLVSEFLAQVGDAEAETTVVAMG